MKNYIVAGLAALTIAGANGCAQRYTRCNSISNVESVCAEISGKEYRAYLKAKCDSGDQESCDGLKRNLEEMTKVSVPGFLP